MNVALLLHKWDNQVEFHLQPAFCQPLLTEFFLAVQFSRMFSKRKRSERSCSQNARDHRDRVLKTQEIREIVFSKRKRSERSCSEGVVAPWCNPLTLQPEQSGGVGSSPGRAPPLERHDKGSRTRLGLLYFCDPSAWR